ncbi:CinA family protein [Rothia aerolata]|uniref:Competence damage-inducible protein A n=1 Tax=Rothia aerolata TaxID=1812262 RepID=A0A917IUS0_9MICC|nr:CinA family protein [Rothia aerolata]GGH63607.1 competence damage-inducible protein A [Rothia aerolata]
MAESTETNPIVVVEQDPVRAAAPLVALATRQGATIASAESLTGGMLGEAICSIAGASAVYLGGVISYASSVKESVLGVSGELLAERGSVDPDVASAMAERTAVICGADFGIATTGAAGPEPHDGKPVGRVYIGVYGPAGARVVEKNYEGDRQDIRQQATFDALQILYREIADA